MQHDLKLQSQYFKEVVTGRKTFEIRKNDRSYKVGDLIRFHEVNENGQYIGYVSRKYQITYITDYEQQDGYVVMSIKLVYEFSNCVKCVDEADTTYEGEFYCPRCLSTEQIFKKRSMR